MEKDILIQNLRTRVGEDNCKVISDKTFEGVAEACLSQFADDSAITDETWNFPVAVLNNYAGQKRHDDKVFAEKFKSEFSAQHEKDVEARVQEAAKKAVEDYIAAHPDNTGGSGSGNGNAADTDIEARVQAAIAKAMEGLTSKDGAIGKLSETVTTYINSQAEREKSAQQMRVKAELKEHLKKLQANNEACIDDALDDINYGDNPTFETLKQSAIDAYEKRYKRYYSDGGKPFGGEHTSGGNDTSFVKNKIAQLKKEAEESANYAAEIKQSFQ